MNIIDTKPELFQKTTASIWTDPYIQQNMLKAHLDTTSDAASRNQASIQTIVNLIDQKIKKNSRLLDLGCGPGLYAEKLAQCGHTVTGIDFNKKAIEYALDHKTDTHYIEGNYISHFPQGEYDAMIMIYCDMGTHSDQDRDVLLQNCYASLTTGGVLIFDVFDTEVVNDKVEGQSWEYFKEAGFWADQSHLLLNQTFHYPTQRAFAYQYNLIQENVCKHFIVWERYYTENEIIGVLERIGFKNISIQRQLLAGNNFTSSHEMFIIAEK